VKPTYKSKVYTDRPAYADFNAPHKFEAIKSIIARRLTEYPNAICSYSGGSDSDIMLHMIESVRKTFDLPPVQYCFFNTGLEMDAIKRHVREMAEQYGVAISEHRPKKA
jgi:3'-phosphoadenosine 5'-phosphosulfate sulfotransferase (PAPS reductase)/FAD synthetase